MCTRPLDRSLSLALTQHVAILPVDFQRAPSSRPATRRVRSFTAVLTSTVAEMSLSAFAAGSAGGWPYHILGWLSVCPASLYMVGATDMLFSSRAAGQSSPAIPCDLVPVVLGFRGKHRPALAPPLAVHRTGGGVTQSHVLLFLPWAQLGSHKKETPLCWHCTVPPLSLD